MSSYIIDGGRKLHGEVSVSGSKNASLPIIAASILNADVTRLYNIPKIQDTKITLDILKILGCKIKINSGKIEINSKNITKTEIPENLMRQMRSTVILAGAILGRFKKVTFSYPGGCEIGARPIDLHLAAFKKMGIQVEEKAGFIICCCDKITAADINLDFPSVGATENIILAATLAEGTTVINNAAMEPEIIDLANCLNKMGAKVQGAGTNVVKITGVKKLKGTGYKVMPDRIEAGTLLCAVAITGGKAKINNLTTEHIIPVIHKLQETGCKIDIGNNYIEIEAPKKLKSVDIKTMPYPGFPTDLQQIFASMLTVAKGTSIIVENIFENRFKYISELIRMGAKITVEGKTAIITGRRKLVGTTVQGTDLRGGASLIIAGLEAKGKTKVENIEYVLRGYENLDEKLNLLGANIKKVGD
ncbi:MAG: UDP-N-acetylglucosamine 1-carboxyvinyltransferase [Clostridia bacterium]|nr:UDP-N-acetylglucosamine 1-carboxyvinyltransferase [Clostridia bacterium]